MSPIVLMIETAQLQLNYIQKKEALMQGEGGLNRLIYIYELLSFISKKDSSKKNNIFLPQLQFRIYFQPYEEKNVNRMLVHQQIYFQKLFRGHTVRLSVVI